MPNDTSFWARLLQRLGFSDALRQAAQPALIDRGFGLIYDTARDITWLQDANYAKTIRCSPDGQMTWPEAMTWVRSLNYRGIRGWRLPTAKNSDGSGPAIGEACAGSELGHLLLEVLRPHPDLVTFTNSTIPCIYWTGTEANANEAYALQLYVIRQGTLAKDPFADVIGHVPLIGPVLSWPVHDGDVAEELRWRWFRMVITSITSFFRR